MVLLQDCREKKGHHDSVEWYCKTHNITLRRVRLNVGDYMFEGGKVSVDTKKNVAELANDLYRDKLAFNKKYKKCFKDGIKLIVLVEEKISSLKQLMAWDSKYTKIKGNFLVEMINDLRVSYGVRFCFCDKTDTGSLVISLLKGEK
jgi:hypothetical protein